MLRRVGLRAGATPRFIERLVEQREKWRGFLSVPWGVRIDGAMLLTGCAPCSIADRDGREEGTLCHKGEVIHVFVLS
eukprot:gene39912-57686_t